MAGTLVIVIGLPGSGKSRYLQSLPGTWAVVAEDYWKDALRSGVAGSRHHDTVLKALHEGKDCLIADIQFCDSRCLDELQQIIRDAVPGVRFDCRYFANDAARCKLNVEDRARSDRNRDASREKRKIDELSTQYRPPVVSVMPIWRPEIAAAREALH